MARLMKALIKGHLPNRSSLTNNLVIKLLNGRLEVDGESVELQGPYEASIPRFAKGRTAEARG